MRIHVLPAGKVVEATGTRDDTYALLGLLLPARAQGLLGPEVVGAGEEGGAGPSAGPTAAG
jgi:hypothetical protein